MLEEWLEVFRNAPILVLLGTVLSIGLVLIYCICDGSKKAVLNEEDLIKNDRFMQALIAKFWGPSVVSLEYEEKQITLVKSQLNQVDFETYDAGPIKPKLSNKVRSLFKPVLDKLSHLTDYLPPAGDNVIKWLKPEEEPGSKSTRRPADETAPSYKGPEQNEETWYQPIVNQVMQCFRPDDVAEEEPEGKTKQARPRTLAGPRTKETLSEPGSKEPTVSNADLGEFYDGPGPQKWRVLEKKTGSATVERNWS